MRVLTFLHSFEPGGVDRVASRPIRQWRAEAIHTARPGSEDERLSPAQAERFTVEQASEACLAAMAQITRQRRSNLAGSPTEVAANVRRHMPNFNHVEKSWPAAASTIRFRP